MIKQAFAIMALAALAASASAQSVMIERNAFGSGTPGSVGLEFAQPVLSNSIFHAPQYMPFYPTAATIWPRVVEVACKQESGLLKCDGYRWTPKMGRAEYLFIATEIIQDVPVPVVYKEVPGPTVYKEVPKKKIKE